MAIENHQRRGSVETFNVDGVPVARGFPFRHVAVADLGGAYLLSLAGMVGNGGDGRLVSSDMYAQARQAIENVRLAISAAAEHLGVPCADALGQVVVTRADLADLAQIGDLNRAYVDAGMPLTARTAVQVAKLPLGAAVEITASAILSNSGAWSPRNR